MRARLWRDGDNGFCLPSISACLSRIEYMSSSLLVYWLASSSMSWAMPANSASFLDDSSSLLYILEINFLKDVSEKETDGSKYFLWCKIIEIFLQLQIIRYKNISD